MIITALTLIERYHPPAYLVDIIGAVDPDELGQVLEHGYHVIDTNVRGWGDHNAIIRTDWADYLATLIGA